MSGGDYLERLEARLNGAHSVHHALGEPHPDAILVDEPDLGAAVAELKQLRERQAWLDGQVFVAGWYAHAEACASLGWDAREAAWRKYREEMAATMAKAAPQSEPPARRSVLLAAIQREGGDWSPLRARTALRSAGYSVESNRAHQIMKTLAAHGYLEQVRPRAYTYRLKTEAPQQPAPDGGGCPCGCPVVEGMCSCPEPCPCEPDCAYCLVPNPLREPERGEEANHA